MEGADLQAACNFRDTYDSKPWDPSMQIIPIMENQMEKDMENEMETGAICILREIGQQQLLWQPVASGLDSVHYSVAMNKMKGCRTLSPKP